MPRRIRFPGLSVRARLGLIQVLLLGALLAVGLVCWRAITVERNAGQVLALLSKAERLHLNADMMHDALRADVNAALRVLPGNTAMAGEVLASARENAHQYESDLVQLRALPLPAELSRSLTQLEPKALAFTALANRLVDAALKTPDQALALEPEFVVAFEDLLRHNDSLTTQLVARAEAAERGLIESAATTKTWIISTSLLAAVVAWAFVALLSRSIRLSLRQVSDAARALAEGNLSVRSEIASQDEVGELAGAVNKMADDLQNMIDRLLSDADRDAFSAQLMQALEMAENERDAQGVVRRAMGQISPELSMEMLLAENEQTQLHAVAEHPVRGRAGCSVDSGDGCVVIRRGAATVFEDSEALNACPRLRDRPGGAVSAVCVPVNFMGHSLGVVHVAGIARRPPSAKQVAQITALGMQAGARIGTIRAFARTQQHAYTDSLTGLANRRAMEPVIAGLQNSKSQYAFALLDLDRFKELNDSHGHEAGDSALQLFAEVVRRHLRQGDHVARWGGEEFAAFFPGANAAQAAEVLQRLRVALAEALLASDVPPFTASYGVSDSSMASTFEQVMRLADEALYVSKERGRDRISVSPGPPVDSETPDIAGIG